MNCEVFFCHFQVIFWIKRVHKMLKLVNNVLYSYLQPELMSLSVIVIIIYVNINVLGL